MSTTQPPRRLSRTAIISAVVSAALAVVCHFLPPRYQALCTAVSQIMPLVCNQ